TCVALRLAQGHCCWLPLSRLLKKTEPGGVWAARPGSAIRWIFKLATSINRRDRLRERHAANHAPPARRCAGLVLRGSYRPRQRHQALRVSNQDCFGLPPRSRDFLTRLCFRAPEWEA